jgi:hypothetical protein
MAAINANYDLDIRGDTKNIVEFIEHCNMRKGPIRTYYVEPGFVERALWTSRPRSSSTR